ncbi:MAG: hypothetical protein HRU26_08125, partial [Psychroserpens sp.]|nr:hypothetical protein [Psychroserpens sp.]
KRTQETQDRITQIKQRCEMVLSRSGSSTAVEPHIKLIMGKGTIPKMMKQFKILAEINWLRRVYDCPIISGKHQLPPPESLKLFLNAYNGSNFDHQFILKDLMKQGIVFHKMMMKGNSLIAGEYGLFSFWDLLKHKAPGKLKDLGKDLGCDIAKGDIDYERFDRPYEEQSKAFQEEIKKYLIKDIQLLEETTIKMIKTFYNETKTIFKLKNKGLNLTSFISIAQASFAIWVRFNEKNNKPEHRAYIQKPTKAQEDFFRDTHKISNRTEPLQLGGIYGGRCYPSKRNYKSEQLRSYLDGELSYDEIKDFLVYIDVNSLYPAAMAHFEYPTSCAYPIGEAEVHRYSKIETWNDEIRNKIIPEQQELKRLAGKRAVKLRCGKKGRFSKQAYLYIKYKPNKYLAQPIHPSKTIDNGLEWSLKDGEGVYTSMEIENMLLYGYEVEVLKHPTHKVAGYYWSKSKPIFTKFIEYYYKKKEEAQKNNKPALRMFIKLFLNSLYGKCVQRPVNK